MADDFCKNFSQEIKKHQLRPKDGKKHRNRTCEMSDSEIMTVLLLFHFGTFKNFKHYYLHYIGVHLKKEFPKQLSYNRFVAIEHRLFVPMMFFLNTVCFGKCTGIETINDELKNICEVEHSRHRAVHNFVMNLISALAAYCFFDKKPAIRFDMEQPTGQIALFE